MLELGESVIKCVCLTISLFIKKKKKKEHANKLHFMKPNKKFKIP